MTAIITLSAESEALTQVMDEIISRLEAVIDPAYFLREFHDLLADGTKLFIEPSYPLLEIMAELAP